METQTFPGRAPEEEAAWQTVQAKLQADPNGFFGGPVPPLAPGASMDDLHPPATFLVSLDAPADGFATNATQFFQGGIDHPLGMQARLNNDLTSTGPESAFLLERRLALNPGESRTIHFLYGYLPDGFSFESLVAKYAANPSAHWSRSNSQWKSNSLQFRTAAEPWAARETAWSSYYLRSGLTYDSFFREHIISQGQGYQYLAGLQGAARDPLQHALPFVFTDPNIVREILRYTIKETQPDGSLPYGIVGSGVPMPCRYRPSDQHLWLLWLASEYVLATRDKQFLDERVPVYPHNQAHPTDLTVAQHLERACAYLATHVGVGKHGLMRLFNGDWNDSIVVNRLTPSQVAEASQHGESVLNAAMAAYVLDYYARMLTFAGRPQPACNPRATAEAQRQAARQQWIGRWFRRAWLGEELGWAGEKQLWLEPQPWAILGGVATPEQVTTLVTTLNELLRQPSPVGALLQDKPDPTMKDDPGVGTNGGVFVAINGTLIWALSQVNGAMAWDEWKKNSLARHAAVYPDMWFSTWSGPDAYNSVLSKSPGSTPPDFPVLNMHPHAWPLYSAAKMLGLEFHETGLNFRPDLPLPEYEFSSSLLGFRKSLSGYSGWYAPLVAGLWNIEINLPKADINRYKQITINGVKVASKLTAPTIRINGESRPGTPLRWEVS
jgi:cellobiose phosphorylase